jgi:hypothetical protein
MRVQPGSKDRFARYAGRWPLIVCPAGAARPSEGVATSQIGDALLTSAQGRAAMRIVAALIKNGEVMDTYTLHVPTRDHLAEAAKKAFTYFRDRYPHTTATTYDVMIAFRQGHAPSLRRRHAMVQGPSCDAPRRNYAGGRVSKRKASGLPLGTGLLLVVLTRNALLRMALGYRDV